MKPDPDPVFGWFTCVICKSDWLAAVDTPEPYFCPTCENARPKQDERPMPNDA